MVSRRLSYNKVHILQLKFAQEVSLLNPSPSGTGIYCQHSMVNETARLFLWGRNCDVI